MNNTIVALWDMLPEGKKIGGAPANFAYHVSQFGLDSRVVSAVGEDELGAEILKNFREKKLNCMIETVPYPTGTVQVELDINGVPCYDIREGVAWDNIPFTPALEGLARQTRAVCFGSLAQRSVVSRETINRFLDAMPDGEGQYKIFDINLRQGFYTKEILCNSMRKCNILKINDGHREPDVRLSGHRPARQVLDIAGEVQPADAHPHLRRKRQLRLHSGRNLVCRDPEGRGGGHGRRGRFVHRRLRSFYPERQARPRSPQDSRSYLGFRLHAKRRNARAARAADGKEHHRLK